MQKKRKRWRLKRGFVRACVRQGVRKEGEKKK